MKTGNPTELVQLLQGEKLSSVVDLDKPHADTLLLEALKVTRDQKEISKVFADRTMSDQAGLAVPEDNRLWSLLMASANNAETQKAAAEEIDAILAQSPKNRQGLLARINMLANLTLQNSLLIGPLLDACRGYCDLFMSKAFCFDDIINRLRIAGPDTIREFRKRLSNDKASDPSLDLFLLKLDYNLLHTHGDASVDALEFASRALQLFTETRERSVSYPEAALLAALGLLSLAARTVDSGLVLQANMILRTASIKFKDYYPLRVLLLQVQMISGQVHLAMDTFLQLSVKNLQWETVGHLLLTRISTLHPRQHGYGEDSLNPLGALDLALTVSDNSQRSLDKAIREGLKHESYSNVMDTVQLRSNLQRSFVRQLYTVEERKCRRVLDIPIKPGLEDVVTDSIDLRDMSFMPTYGTADEHLSKLLSCGPRPQQGWLDVMRLQEHLLVFMVADLGSSDTNMIAWTHANLKEARANVSNDIPTDLTISERETGLCTMIISGVITGLSAKLDELEENTGKIVTLVQNPSTAERLKPAVVNQVEYPDWQYLHHQFVRLELLRIVAMWVTVMNKKLKAEKDKTQIALTENLRGDLGKLRGIVAEEVKSLHNQTRELKEKLSASGVLGRLVDAVLGRTGDVSEAQKALGDRLQGLQDEATVEEYCGLLRESWEDALDGILATKVKIV